MPTDDDPTVPDPEPIIGPPNDTPTDTSFTDDRFATGAPLTPRGLLPVVPGYTVTSIVGEGGMGAVYEAQQHKPARRVALKLIRPGAVTPRSIRRFEHEQEVLARLQHPGIAAIYEAGLHEGTPFFAMEFIDGPTLTEYAERNKLDTRDRLALFVQVCDAVHHAHAKGVIHRDLKPGNILVAQLGDPPVPQAKVLDFGIARVTESDIQVTTMHTDLGQIVGTLPYMSPEQVAGENDNIDTRSDVYALGVVLYELLVGQLPYDLKHRLIHEAVRVIREDVPTRLSGVNTKFRGDIETIVGKAMEKQRDRRYQSASDLGSDIRRYLVNEPIQARPPSRGYLLRKFVQRHKGLVTGVAATFAVLVAGIIGTGIFAVRADVARADAVAAQVETERARQAEADERRRAENNARLAEIRAVSERERAEELKLVVAFQKEQLAGIDTQMMGIKLRQSLLDEARTSAKRAGWDEKDILIRLQTLNEALAGTNFTDLALRSMDQNIFQRALAVIEEQFSNKPLLKAQLLQTVATTLRELGLLAGASQAQTQALTLHRQMLGNDHPITLTSIANMGALLQTQGRLEEAEPLFIEALKGSRRVLGNDHPDTLKSISGMGALLQSQGRRADAEPLFREALKGFRRVLGPEHPETLRSVNSLGSHLASRGRRDEAEPLLREALVGFRRVLGEDHPDTLNAIKFMATLSQLQGRLSEAELLFREVMQGFRRVRGDDHPDTLNSINSVAGNLIYQGRLKEAESLYREVLSGFRRVLGDDHPDTLSSFAFLGVVLQSQRRLDEAKPHYGKALEGKRRVLGDDHPETLSMIKVMAVLLRAQGRLAEAEPLFVEVVEGRRRVLGANHPDTLESINLLINLYTARHKAEPTSGYEKKAAYWRDVLENDQLE